jgi:nucleoside phosphorylase
MNIPNSVIYAVGDVLGSWYYSHTKLNTLFGANGFPGDPPAGNCIQKCQEWMRRANKTGDIDPLEQLGLVLVEFMNLDHKDNPLWDEGFRRVVEVFAKNDLVFELNGRIVPILSEGFAESPRPSATITKSPSTKPAQSQTICDAIDYRTIVLLTVNDNETHALLDAFLGKGKPPPHILMGSVTYNDLGIHGGYRIVNTVCEMGAGGIGASQQRTRQAIDHWHPSAIIAVGIAFGLDETKQEIGDVLISTQLQDYDLSRLNADGTLTPRADKPSCSDALRNRLRQTDMSEGRRHSDWPKVRFGPVLSGQKLLDNLDYRDSLKALFTEAIGGEMEGTGIYVSASEAKVDWIVIKGICDWGYNKNQADKDAWQRLAAKNAARVLKAALDVGSLNSSEPGKIGDPHAKTSIAQASLGEIKSPVLLDKISSQIYTDLVETATEGLMLRYWSWFTDHAVRFLLSEEFVDGVNGFWLRVNRTIWPMDIPELEHAIQNLGERTNIYVKAYMKKAKYRPSGDSEKNGFWVEDNWWKMRFNKDYHKYLEESSKWEKQCYSLLVNVVVALNQYAKMVRKYLIPEYLIYQGKFIINDAMGVTSEMIPSVYIPEEYIDVEIDEA